MISPLFWTLYLPIIGALFLLSMIAGYVGDKARRVYHRWQIRRELMKPVTPPEHERAKLAGLAYFGDSRRPR